jgi:hypothetical protein
MPQCLSIRVRRDGPGSNIGRDRRSRKTMRAQTAALSAQSRGGR